MMVNNVLTTRKALVIQKIFFGTSRKEPEGIAAPVEKEGRGLAAWLPKLANNVVKAFQSLTTGLL